jgi:ubiquinone/menaquinone biosynthesis C-methylase UbiE
MAEEDYVKALRRDAAQTDAYHRRSITKTEQQKFLEELLVAKTRRYDRIADIACGGGSLTYHLRALYPNAAFTLCDRDDAALAMARTLNGEGCTYVNDDVYTLSTLPDDTFDLVCCWQALSWIDRPEDAVRQLLRIVRPGGSIMASSLFDRDHQVDIRAQVRDRTRPSGQEGHWYAYNTFSLATVEEWLAGQVTRFALHPFDIGIDLPRTGPGIGTYTIRTEEGRIQVSGGVLMNWSVLEIEK